MSIREVYGGIGRTFAGQASTGAPQLFLVVRTPGGDTKHLTIRNMDNNTDLKVFFDAEAVALGIGYTIPGQNSEGNIFQAPIELVDNAFWVQAASGTVSFEGVAILRRG